MKFIKSSLALFTAILLMSATSCQEDKYPDLGDGLFAEIITSKGTMVAKLTPEKTPLTVANFVALAEGVHPMVSEEFKGKPYYNGIIFHRVMDQFMIQGGDPTGSGRGNPGYRFGNEPDESLRHDRAGILSMANSGGTNTNGSQFFITEVPYPSLDSFDNLDNLKNCDAPRVSCHTVFGELVIGLEIQDTISNVTVDASKKPIEDVVIEQINIVRQGFKARKFDAVKTWETELPLLDEKRKQKEEEARSKAEETQKLIEAKTASAAAEVLPSLNDYKAQAKTSASGLMYHFIKKGNGIKPKQGQNVKVNYEGYFIDGRLFDSNVKEVEEKFGKYNIQKDQQGAYAPMAMRVSPDAKLIAGFKEGVTNMSVGDKTYLYIPAHLGWGERGSPPLIEANTDVIFIIEMVEILDN